MCLTGKKRPKTKSGDLGLMDPDKEPIPGGMKRLRDGDSGDMGISPSSDKKTKLEEGTTLKKPEPRLRRSNSVDRTGSKLSISDRHTSNTKLKKGDMKDFSVMAVFSREAFENFGKKWKAKMNTETLELATPSSRKGVSDVEMKKILDLQAKTLLGTDFKAQVGALLDNKTSPHVIGVIEGKEELASFSIKAKAEDKEVDVTYTRVGYIQGENAKHHSDYKQSMSLYVRDDMRDVYNISKETVSHGAKSINSLGVNYATKDGTKYQTLIVHIPNEFIGNKGKEEATHQAFADYAEQQRLKTKPVIVTSYFGDTNYSSSIRDYSSPSMGGHLKDGSTLNPRSSGANKETHFMQSVPLNEGASSHSLLQPSTLNYVFINPDEDNREATDHPSIMQYVALNNELEGRPDKGALKFLDFE